MTKMRPKKSMVDKKVAFRDELKMHLQKMVLGGKFKPEKLHSIPKELKV